MDNLTKEEKKFTVKFKPCSSKKDVLPSKRVSWWKARKTVAFIILLILLIVPILFSSSKSITYGADGSWTQLHTIGASFPIVKGAVAIDLKYKLYLPFSSELENVHSVTLGIRFRP